MVVFTQHHELRVINITPLKKRSKYVYASEQLPNGIH